MNNNKQEPNAQEIREQKIYRELGLSDYEYNLAVKLIGRDPNYLETGLFSVMWSEHCSYKTSKNLLRKFPTKGVRVLQGPGEGAGVVDIGDNQAVVFKIESHNHPSAVEPYEGAATGVGGIVRDVFSMGARPIAMLNSLRFGPFTDPRVKHLFKYAVKGIGDYGNRLGIPTVGGEVVFEESYLGNPLVNAMCVGLVDHDKMQRGLARGVGNSLIYAGAPTGKDGIHGATFASVELTDETESPDVQAGDPFTEKRLLEATLELLKLDIIEGIQDMGAAGLTSSSTEMASKAGTGVVLDLSLVPQRDPDMSPYEIMLSESQERMLVVSKAGKEAEIAAVYAKWDIDTVVVGKVTDDKRYRILHEGKVVCDMPVAALVDEAPVYTMETKEPAYYRENQALHSAVEDFKVQNYAETLLQLLAQPNIASKEWVYRQYDHTARFSTVVKPGGDAGVIKLRGTNKALAMTTDGNGRYIYLDPYVGGAIAVAEAARNLVCTGGTPIALTDGINFGNPEKPEIYWSFDKSVDGIVAGCKALDIPVIGGNVSLYNEYAGEAIYPTPIIGMVGLIEKPEYITDISFKEAGDRIILLGTTYAELTGTEFQKLAINKVEGKSPAIDLAIERNLHETVLNAIHQGLVRSAHDLSEGGLAVALVESAVAGGKGAKLNISADLSAEAILFSESQSRVLLTAKAENVAAICQLAKEKGIKCLEIGEVASNKLTISYNDKELINLELAKIDKTWREAIPCAMSAKSATK